MLSAPRFSPLLSAAWLWLAALTGASAEWLVYELRFTPEAGSVNFSFYSGAYVIAPVQGGPASIVLTTEEGGRFYAVAESSGKFFVAANAETRKAVFSAAALSRTSQAFYSAAGPLNRSLLLHGSSGARSWRVAETLSGRLLAADDESERGPSPDGSFGVVGEAQIRGSLREDLSLNTSLQCTTQESATAYLLELLEKYGYGPDGEDAGAEPAVSPPLESAVIDPSLFPAATRPAATAAP